MTILNYRFFAEIREGFFRLLFDTSGPRGSAERLEEEKIEPPRRQDAKEDAKKGQKNNVDALIFPWHLGGSRVLKTLNRQKRTPWPSGFYCVFCVFLWPFFLPSRYLSGSARSFFGSGFFDR